MSTSVELLPTARSRAQDAGRGAADRTGEALDRLISLARRLGRAVRTFTVLVAVAAMVIVASAVWLGLPGSAAGWALFAIGVTAVVAPPVVLWIFSSVLRDVLELPAKVRAMPVIRLDLLGHDVVFKLLSVPFLVVVGIAFLAGVVELFLAPAALVFAGLVDVLR